MYACGACVYGACQLGEGRQREEEDYEVVAKVTTVAYLWSEFYFLKIIIIE